jgi:hypothetical protein
MSWFNRFLFRISAYCRCRVINGPDQQPYLERYHLLRLPFGYQAYLHRFVASDPGRGLHNHPWRHALSLVLCGSYREVRMRDAHSDNRLYTRHIGAGHLNLISGDTFHRVNIATHCECWSLFIHAPKAKSWGFLQSKGYRDHNEVVADSSNPLWWKQAYRPIQNPQMRLPSPV